jgi:hypothetical protein
LLELEDLALGGAFDFLGQIAVRHGRCHGCDFAHCGRGQSLGSLEVTVSGVTYLDL